MDNLISLLIDRLRYSPAIEMDSNCIHANEAGELLPPRRANPPLQIEELQYVERQLGFSLPGAIRRISLEVADGGFGPNWGINRLKHPANLPFGPWWDVEMSVESWHQMFQDPNEMGNRLAGLPKHFIRYCEVGCNIAICVDCTSPEGLLFMDDPMANEVTSMNQTVEQWLTGWLESTPWPETLYS